MEISELTRRGLADGERSALARAKVLLVGAGGLGSPAALALAAAGVGVIGLADADQVEVSNLQRQVLHRTSDLGRIKAGSGGSRLKGLNPKVRIVSLAERLTPANALDWFQSYDLVIDGSDNFPTRYLCGDTSVQTGTPLVHGSIFRFDGQLSVFWPGRGPCYRCLFPEPPPPGSVPSCAQAGVLGVLPGLIGSLMALEAVKVILNRPSLIGRLLLYNSLTMDFTVVRLRASENCRVCGVSQR